MKKLLLALTIVGLASVSYAAQITTNIVTKGTYLLSTSRASVYSLTLTSDKSTLVELFDADSVADPYFGTNYVNAAYTYRTSYATNYVTSYVGQNGWTNWYTNAGIWTVTLTNAANTNALSPLISGVVGANTYVTYDVDAVFANGVVARASTNVSVVINYRPGN